MDLRRTLARAACFLALCQATSLAAFDAYLQLRKDGAPIETDAQHSWVEILGFEHGLQTTVSLGGVTGGSAGKATAYPATLHMGSDASIAEMMSGLATGQPYTLTLQLARGAKNSYTHVLTELTFDGVLFSNIEASAAAGNDLVHFAVSFQYQKLAVIHTRLDSSDKPAPSGATGWDFAANTALDIRPGLPALGEYAATEPTTPGLDTDQDLIPDAWEILYGLDPEDPLDAALDPDGDGFTNLEEFIAGTHPRQGNSFFQLKMTTVAGQPQPTTLITWSARANRAYRIQASDTPRSGFTDIHTLTPETDGPQSYAPPPATGPFYRLLLTP